MIASRNQHQVSFGLPFRHSNSLSLRLDSLNIIEYENKFNRLPKNFHASDDACVHWEPYLLLTAGPSISLVILDLLERFLVVIHHEGMLSVEKDQFSDSRHRSSKHSTSKFNLRLFPLRKYSTSANLNQVWLLCLMCIKWLPGFDTVDKNGSRSKQMVLIKRVCDAPRNNTALADCSYILSDEADLQVMQDGTLPYPPSRASSPRL